MNISEKQAQYVITIVSEGSISAAARKLFISQPSLSQTVKQIEAELGMPIFRRDTEPISLTDAGERYLHAAHQTLQLMSELKRSIASLSKEEAGVVRFGIPVQRGLQLLPLIVPRFHRRFPQVELKLVERGSATLGELLEQGGIDVAVLTCVPRSERLHYILLEREQIVLLADRRTALAKRIPEGTPILITEAKDELFVSNISGHSISAVQEELFAKNRMQPGVLCSSSNIGNCQRITVNSGAVMLCADSYIEPGTEISKKGAVYPIKDAVERRGCYLAYRKDLYLTKYMRALIDLISGLRQPEIYDRPVEVQDMLAARDRRALLQKRMLASCNAPLICLTLNIPGPIKVFPGIPYAFERALSMIRTSLREKRINIVQEEKTEEATGYEAFLSVSADAKMLKQLMCKIEDGTMFGRLLDIDVLNLDGSKVSRVALGLPMRRCMLCEEPAHACSRNRTHPITELTAHVKKQILLAFLEEACKNALLAELYTTPKPGLVDLHDCGAHKDMDCQSFERSTEAILPYLLQMAEEAYSFAEQAGKSDAPPALSELFVRLRPIGMSAETAMFAATGGVNTHKGMIFIMGSLMASAAYCKAYYGTLETDGIFDCCREMLHDAVLEDFAHMDKKHPASHGEQLFAKHGLRGVRGEAAEGFPSVRYHALSFYRTAKKAGEEQNRLQIETLLRLMTKVYDTTVLYRAGQEMLGYMQQEAQALLCEMEAGLSEGALSHRLYEMNLDFIEKNISPGGCADLLAATVFTESLESYR